MASQEQSRPDSGLDFQVKALQTFEVVSSLLGSGLGEYHALVAGRLLKEGEPRWIRLLHCSRGGRRGLIFVY